jgi:uncharacterized protein DUF6328
VSDEDRGSDQEFEELLQELRVALPGVQVLLAFLLVVPFNSGFDQLSDADRVVFLAAVLCAAVASILMIAPSAHHRFAWPIGPEGLEWLLRVATIEARVGVTSLGLAIVASVFVVADVIFGVAVAVVCSLGLGILVGTLWIAVPLATRRRYPPAGREIGHPTRSRAGG